MSIPKKLSQLEFSVIRDSDIQRAVITTTSSSLLKGFEAYDRHKLGIVVSELSTNIIKYAGEGIIRIQHLEENGKTGIRIDAIDKGPGIKNLEFAFKEGYSTGGSLGLGLPAVRRLMTNVDVSFPKEGGTHITTTWFKQSVIEGKVSKEVTTFEDEREITFVSDSTNSSKALLNFKVDTFTRSWRGNKYCGDIVWFFEAESYLLIVHIDGSGHGYEAFRAASLILTHIQEDVKKWPPQPIVKMLILLMCECNEVAKSTVGGAVSLVLIDRISQELHYIGVGNITVLLFSYRGWEGIPKGGIVGSRFNVPRVSSVKLNAGDTVISFSDGLSSSIIHKLRKDKVSLSEPKEILDMLMKAVKDNDDASCIVTTCY